MAFWGTEVKSGDAFEVSLGEGKRLHLDQVTLGKGYHKEQEQLVYIHIIVDGQDLVIGTLDTQSLPTEFVNLMFYKNFKIRHTMKNASVYIYGSTFKRREKKETTTKKVNKAQTSQKGLNPSRSKDAKVIQKRRKEAFFSELGKPNATVSTGDGEGPSWAPLRDNYMLTTSKLKDWDKAADAPEATDDFGRQEDSSSDDDED